MKRPTQHNIKDIAPLLASHFIDVDENEEETANTANIKLLNDNKSRLGLFHKYIWMLHDSPIIKAELQDNLYTLTLNDITTCIFSDVVTARYKLKHGKKQLVFPVHLQFDVNALTYYTVDESGIIHEIKPVEVHEYLYEQIIAINDNEITIGFVLWRTNKNTYGQHIFVLASIKDIHVIEEQDKAWANDFGTSFDNCYHYFRSKFNAGSYLGDQNRCNDLIDEYERQLN